jgi:hypothetical protein
VRERRKRSAGTFDTKEKADAAWRLAEVSSSKVGFRTLVGGLSASMPQ